MDDVIIVGAGIAGLVAAQALARQGFSVTVLEGRSRVGGRIHSIKNHSENRVIELGAEFVHGGKNALWPVLRQLRLETEQVVDRHWVFSGESLSEDKTFWEKLEQVIAKMPTHGRDQDLRTFLEHKRELSASAKTMTQEYVEGFHAAAPERVSVHSLARAEAASEEDEGTEQFRLARGYGALVEWFKGRGTQGGAKFRLKTVVEEIEWVPGEVQVHASTPEGQKRFHGRTVLITLPLGVLQQQGQGGVRFKPALKEREPAIRSLAMGTVVKIVLEFRSRFWPVEHMGFIHAPGRRFATWWSDERGGAPLLTGWSGSKRAASLAELSSSEILAEAIYSLATMFQTDRQHLEQMLVASYYHDWNRDRFSRGAYSYTPKGTTRIARQLSKPVQETVYFAGEATDTQGNQGTVHAALTSGRIAARGIVRALSRRSNRSRPSNRISAGRKATA